MQQQFIYTKAIIDELKKHLASESFKYVYYPKFIFLCGKGVDPRTPEKYYESNRGIIEQYILAKAPNTHIVLSERLWENGFLSEIDLLTFEEFLAEISDCIIIFVESMGSSCELGAFTFQETLFMDKLILILNQKYRNDDSFINHGPVEKAKNGKVPVIYADLEGALLSSRELIHETDTLLKSMQQKCALNKRQVNPKTTSNISLGSFIVEILELIRLLQPVSKEDLVYVYKQIKDLSSFEFVKRDGKQFSSRIHLSYLLKLLVKVNVIKQENNLFALGNLNNSSNLLFTFSPASLSRNRCRILSRRYKYKVG